MSAAFDVIIVGGGAAGIGAARTLFGRGLSTRIVEAAPRLGGRAWTQEIGGHEVDVGAGWMHSADRNSWAAIAKASGLPLEQDRAAWRAQYRDLGFPPAEQDAAWKAFNDWLQRLSSAPPDSDRAADALVPGDWSDYVRAIVGFISGGTLEELSVVDYLAYDENSTDSNWRVRSGYGALIANACPVGVPVSLATPVDAIALDSAGVKLSTRKGEIRARAIIITVSSCVLAGDTIQLPRELEPWRDAAKCLPLGRNEKLFLEVIGQSPFEAETHVIGNPLDLRTGSYYIRPFGRPVIECFFGGEGARTVEDSGPAAGFAFAIDQLATLFGAEIRRLLRPLMASNWSRDIRVGGAYSYALPRCAAARQRLAQPFDNRVFFAGEATSAADFSTAHGAHDSGVRAANEVLSALKG